MNLTKTIRKLPINEDGQRAGYYVHDDFSNVDIKYDEPTVRVAPCQAFMHILQFISLSSWLVNFGRQNGHAWQF